MQKLADYTKAIVLLLTAILILQIFFLGDCIKSNVYLQHENSKIKIVEKKVLGYRNCEKCPPCKSMADIQAQ